ncbi:alpha-amylase [Leptolyngbya sp. FACHB-711]|uniref:alpha-amylase n=1 Tax=Leptolyngbya sp. FACHB-711 TaxID=2692813 RepID=UPI00168279AB|nr:alpha-amylase [Leptolyngbya sp. FACHB-711]MBD1853036.1 alpha-amylase [Cyanobacteria bacterium FACHB-502]MBD2024621.1 alpha-amylase [Leptolyngbya sp. FACHB-711]
MTNVFQQLEQRFHQLGKDLTPEVVETATQSLQEWLERNIDCLAARKPGAEFNGTMMQWFHWYLPSDGTHWNQLADRAQELAKAGITAIWMPPACKAMEGENDVGYGIYDLYDLGEFNQSKSTRTKYGTKDEYVAAVKAIQRAGMQAYADVVFNHKMGADCTEEFEVVPYDRSDRNCPIDGERTIRGWTEFSFPGRGDKYSSMKWHWWHFDALDYDDGNPGYRAVYQVKGKSFDTKVDLRQGNYDYLMGCDLDMNHPEVRGELKYWGEWLMNTVGLDGFRLDAIKHINGDFFSDWLDHLEHYAEKDLFCVGEYWTEDFGSLSWYIGNAGGRLNLFDVPLHYNFHRASLSGGNYDMRSILDNTLMKHLPMFAVTLVDNHDTQPLQALESIVESWFKPLAYAVILLRAEGYPCIFYADYYGAHYRDKGRDGNEHEIWLDSHRWLIDRFLFARQYFAYGAQYDYFDHWDIIGWTRLGSEQHPGAMAVIMSDGPDGSKWMEVGKPNTTFYDITEHIKEPVRTNQDGWGEFRCNGGSVSVWVERDPLLSCLTGLPIEIRVGE